MASFAVSARLIVLLALIAAVVLAAVTSGCDDKSKAGANVAKVTIAGKVFWLEIAAEHAVREKGLMGREHIESDGGMIFVFPPSGVGVQSFWMKNCLTDMDIIYLDGSGRVVGFHEMKKQPPKAADETEEKYEERMRRDASYSSRFPATFAIEVAPGKVKELGIKEADLIEFDAAGLKKQAK